jgi:hypothetical protein
VIIKIADALNVSIDYLVGKTSFELNKDMLKRFQEVSSLPESAKKTNLYGNGCFNSRFQDRASIRSKINR